MVARMTKYRAEPTVVDGIRFASKKEARRYSDLMLLQRAGEIRNLQRQVKIPLQGKDAPIRTPKGRQAHYIADFTYFTEAAFVVEDVKGKATPVYLLKKAILAAQGVRVVEV